MDIFEKIKNCKSKDELDNIRLECVKEMDKSDNPKEIQKAFIKQKNKLQRNGWELS